MILRYFGNSRLDWRVDGRIEEAEAVDAREQINRSMNEAHSIILSSGISPVLQVTPPPAAGGYVRSLDLVTNIFHIHLYQITSQSLLDFIDRSIGIYERNSRPALYRLFNPFYYLGLLFELIARLPFILIGRVGFNGAKVEGSTIGRVFKGVIQAIAWFASFLTVLNLLGYLESAKGFVRSLFHWIA